VSGYRPAFEAALRLFARASERHVANGFERPVLVGGAAVELYTSGAVTTGDFDIVTGAQDAFEQSLRDLGFVRPSGPGKATRGWVHPDLRLGFEVVSSMLLDGRAERSRVRLLGFGVDGAASVIAVEDMIAGRMGQHASGSAPESLGQARELFALYGELDREYLERRIREETLDEHGIDALRPDPV
jgi:hypothetical protein